MTNSKARSNTAMFFVFLMSTVAILVMGCNRTAEPAKTPAAVKESGKTEVSPKSPEPSIITASPPPEPPKAVRVFMIELDAKGRALVNGETIAVPLERMIFLRDSRMQADCGNVQVTNLYMKGMGSICQVGILPLEQGLKPGDNVTATWRVGSETRSFQIRVLPGKTAEEELEVRFWKEAKAWFQKNALLASL